MGNPCGCTKSDCNSACFRAFLRTPSTDLTAFMQELTRSSPIFRVESFAASRIALTRAIRLKSPKLQERGPTADLGPPASKHFIEMLPTWIWLGEHTQHEVLPAGLCDVATCGQHLLTAMRDATSSRADSKLTRRLCSGLANLSACMALGTALRFRTLLKRYPNVFPNERRQPMSTQDCLVLSKWEAALLWKPRRGPLSRPKDRSQPQASPCYPAQH